MISVSFSEQAPSIIPVGGERINDDGIVYGYQISPEDVVRILTPYWNEKDDYEPIEEYIKSFDSILDAINDGLAAELTDFLHETNPWTEKAGIGVHSKLMMNAEDGTPPMSVVLGIRYSINFKDDDGVLMYHEGDITPISVFEAIYPPSHLQILCEDPDMFPSLRTLWTENFEDLNVYDLQNLLDAKDILTIMFGSAQINKKVGPVVSIIV